MSNKTEYIKMMIDGQNFNIWLNKSDLLYQNINGLEAVGQGTSLFEQRCVQREGQNSFKLFQNFINFVFEFLNLVLIFNFFEIL